MEAFSGMRYFKHSTSQIAIRPMRIFTMNSDTLGSMPQRILDTADSVAEWVEHRHYRGYEPFDGLSSWMRPLAFGQPLPLRLLQQFVRQCPVNVRPILGVRPKDSTKGRGYMAWGYLTLYRVLQREELLSKATECLRWLERNKVPHFRHHSWANHFDFASRAGLYTSNDPIIVWTALIGQAFADAFEITGQDWFLDVARSVCDWIMELPRESTPQGDCLSYLADRQLSIHNANMLGAAILARVAKLTGQMQYAEVARSAVAYTCSRQREDGSWWYAEEAAYQWIDNFHTGYNLDSLKCFIVNTGAYEYEPHLTRGLAYYLANFVDDDGCPKYYHDRRYPVDIQCAAQCIETLAVFGEESEECLAAALKVANWTIDNMRASDGHFFYRRLPFVAVRTPMLHWGQATMYRALCRLYATLRASASHVV